MNAEDIVLEIGSGPGALTQALLETGAAVVAVEKDAVFATALERLKSPAVPLTIFCHDIMTFSPAKGTQTPFTEPQSRQSDCQIYPIT